jgi:CRP/FNR family cyclic AMP-dependent transcriptional regulator
MAAGLRMRRTPSARKKCGRLKVDQRSAKIRGKSAWHPFNARDKEMRMAEQQAFDPQAFLDKVGAGRTVVACPKQHSVFTQGEAADAVFYLQDGQVKLTVVSAQGKEAVIAILAPRSFLGEGCLAGQPLRMATATTLTDCTLMRIEKQAMLWVLHAEPAFSALFMAYLLSRNSRIEADLIDQLFNSSEKRLARVLLLLAHFGKEGKAEPVIPQISQETLAEMIGTTRSRVNFFLNKFRKLGFIDYNGELRVHSSLLNVVLHD